MQANQFLAKNCDFMAGIIPAVGDDRHTTKIPYKTGKDSIRLVHFF